MHRVAMLFVKLNHRLLSPGSSQLFGGYHKAGFHPLANGSMRGQALSTDLRKPD